MQDVFRVKVPYAIKYTTKHPVPIAEIVDSLQSLEKLIKRTPAFLEAAFDGLKVVETNVYVEKIESGSLYQKLIVELAFGGAENHEQAKQLAAKIVKDSTPVRTVVALGLGSVITFGVMKALEGAASGPSTHIQAHHSLVLNAGGDVNLSASKIEDILDSISDQKTLAREAVAVVRPAKADGTATIEFESMPELNIPASVIAEAPGDYEPAMPQERTVHYDNVTLLIAASDKDKRTTGWAGSVPGVFDARKPFKLDDSVDPASLHGKTRTQADISVHERYIKSKNSYQSHSVTISKIYP